MKAAAILILLALAGCVDSAEPEAERQPGIDRDGRRDLVGLDIDISGKRGGDAYSGYDAHRDLKGSGLAFAGYGCMTDCKDGEAGYRAAEAQHVVAAKQCTGATWAAVEGCVALTQGFKPAITKLVSLEAE